MAIRWVVVLVAVTLAAAGAALWYALQRPDAPAPAFEAPPAEEAERTRTAAAPATLIDIAAMPRDFRRNAALYDLLATADVARVKALLAEAHTLPAAMHRYDMSRLFYLRFVSLDPVAAADHLLANVSKPSWVHAVFRSWAHKDFDAAVAYAAKLGPLARQAAAEAILELDISPAQRESAIALMRTPQALANALLWEGRLHAGEDIADAWRRAGAIPRANWKERRRLLGEIAAEWGRADPLAAMAAIEALNSVEREKAQPIALQAWADVDPYAAVDWLLEREPHKRPQELVAAAMGSLADQDPDAALNALTTMPEPARGQALSATLTAMAGADADKALAAYEALDEHERAQVSMRYFAPALAQAAPDQAMSWILDLPENAAGRMAVPMVMIFAHETDRELVLRRIGAIEDPALQHTLAREVALKEVERDPRAAWRWANSLPAVAERSVVGEVFDDWYRMDAAAALDALSELRGDARDRLLEEAVASRVTFNTEDAETLFAAIDSPASKARAAPALARYFTESNPDEKKADMYREFVESADGEGG